MSFDVKKSNSSMIIVVTFTGKCENMPQLDHMEDIVAACGPLASAIHDFVNARGSVRCTENGLGFGEWDIGFFAPDLLCAAAEVSVVIDKFRTAYNSGLFWARIATYVRPGTKAQS